jgi:gamma-glutamylcyclotransferase (GGCT)/AIG2-like uncharacterized protein YtfP
MRLFLYGTLLHPESLARRSGDAALPARRVAASLRGWQRISLPGIPWPTLRRAPGATVDGIAVIAGAAALRRLAAWEGDAYRLQRVMISTSAGKVSAWTWIAAAGTLRAQRG